MIKVVLSSLVALVAFAAAATPAAAVPTQVSFAGRLAGADGPIDGTVDLGFRMYEGTTMVWSEDHAVLADDGMIFVALGSQVPLDASVFDGGPLQLEIVIDGEPSSPRLPILSVPYAHRAGVAAEAERVGGMEASAFAAAAHDHDGDYLPLGTSLACTGANKVTGINAAGNVTCGADQNTTYGVTAGDGLELNAGNNFGIASSGVTRSHLQGTEPAIYQRNSFCASRGGDLWPSASSCDTGACGINLYWTCAGSCSSTTAVSCPPTLLGYLVAP
jgi:hypothetical protein